MGSVMNIKMMTSCQPHMTKLASRGKYSGAIQVRCTTYNDVAINAVPPKAKITKLVCNGRRRPNENQAVSKFKAGQASCEAMITPTLIPIMPQKIVMMASCLTTFIWYCGWATVCAWDIAASCLTD